MAVYIACRVTCDSGKRADRFDNNSPRSNFCPFPNFYCPQNLRARPNQHATAERRVPPASLFARPAQCYVRHKNNIVFHQCSFTNDKAVSGGQYKSVPQNSGGVNIYAHDLRNTALQV